MAINQPQRFAGKVAFITGRDSGMVGDLPEHRVYAQ